jgi:hypothetical protein
LHRKKGEEQARPTQAPKHAEEQIQEKKKVRNTRHFQEKGGQTDPQKTQKLTQHNEKLSVKSPGARVRQEKA